MKRWIGFISLFIIALIMAACFLMAIGEMFEWAGW